MAVVSNPPLVSCVMPTYGRPDYVAESVALFLAQDYPAKELVILNDCPGQVFIGDFPGVRIVNSPTRWATLGEKRNAAIELTRGEFLAVWDDDDLYLPWRLSQAMRRMAELGTALYCPAEYWAYWGDQHLHDNQAVMDWIYHPVVVFHKELWRVVGGYPPQTKSEDTVFFNKVLRHLGMEWPRDPVSPVDRPMILRGRSKYIHTSIDGGRQEPDLAAREIQLKPIPTADPILRSVFDRLIEQRHRQQVRLTHSMTSTVRASMDSALRPSDRIWLDEIEPQRYYVGYGDLGLEGDLGYEAKAVEIEGRTPSHAVSAHAPARLCYALGGRYRQFCCRVALNDDVSVRMTSADFQVWGDGRMMGIARNVQADQPPQPLTVDVTGVDELELVIHPHRWEFCHTVWIEPYLELDTTVAPARVLVDALQRAEITIPSDLPDTSLCIATVGSPGFGEWIDDLFGSIGANAQCPQALLAIFSFEDSDEIRRVAEKYRAVVIPCRALKPLNVACKSVLYSAGRLIPAEKFICLDADMLVLDDLRPLLATLDATPAGAILVCKEANWSHDLEDAVIRLYGGTASDIDNMTGDVNNGTRRYPLVVNDGFFAGSRPALCALDDQVRGLNGAANWVDDPDANVPWRNQFVFNLALARTNCGVEVHARYNVQLHVHHVEFDESETGLSGEWNGEPAAIVHFSGSGRHRAMEWRGRYRQSSRPPVRTDVRSHGYDSFVAALRSWIGQFGLDALIWSFYGTTDGRSSRVIDASTFPLFATLHYLIRSNGCSRVIETGTARGVSSACLASAVAHRPDARVVSIDLCAFPEREALWARLPDAMRSCIEPRQIDAVTGLNAALAAGESYHAALLDTVHSEEHVWSEFELATQLVCPGGLILVHDAALKTGTVNAALDRIQDLGYGVCRLWTAEAGHAEDDQLGLAIIENRVRILSD